MFYLAAPIGACTHTFVDLYEVDVKERLFCGMYPEAFEQDRMVDF
jgi:hypothetical protein